MTYNLNLESLKRYVGEEWAKVLHQPLSANFFNIHQQMIQRKNRIPKSYMDIFAPLRACSPDEAKVVVIGEG